MDSTLYQYNIESETLTQIKFSKFALQDFGIIQMNNEYQWWATSLNGEIFRANKHKGTRYLLNGSFRLFRPIKSEV